MDGILFTFPLPRNVKEIHHPILFFMLLCFALQEGEL